MHLSSRFMVLIMLGLLCSVAGAVDDPGISRLEVKEDGATKVYEEVAILKVTATGVRIAHKDGLATVKFSQLPPDLRSKFEPKSKTPEAEPLWPSMARDKPNPSPVPQTAPAPSVSAQPQAPVSSTWTTSGKPERTGVAVQESFDPKSLVIIRMDGGSGSGFIAREGGRDYIYTNAHVICGDAEGGFSSGFHQIATPSGRDIPVPDEIEFSMEAGGLDDIVRFPIHVTDERVYEITSISGATAGMNEAVVAYGNSDGRGVVTSLEGQIIGVGPGVLEITCEIIHGNSGGPVVLKNTKQVVGISSFLIDGTSDNSTRGTRFERSRRFALMPDQVGQWFKMPTPSLFRLLGALQSYGDDSCSLVAACCLRPKSNRAVLKFRTRASKASQCRTSSKGGVAITWAG